MAEGTGKNLYITSINVKTLLSDTRIIELSQAIESLKWDILGLSEIRREKETIEEYSEFILYHTSTCNSRNGVGFLVKKYLKNNIVSFRSFSDRVATLQIQISESSTWSFVQAYAPTETYSNEEMDIFYQSMETALDSLHPKNVLLLGDFNARVGKMQRGEENVFGKFSYGERSKHGQKLVEFALEKNFKIINSMFKLRTNKKWTWRHPNGRNFNEIDYMLTNQPTHVHQFDIINNLNYNTDHRMIRCKLSVQANRIRRHIKPSTEYTRELPVVTGEDAKYWESKFIESVNSSNEVQKQYNNLENELKRLLKQLPKKKKKEHGYINPETKELLHERKILYTEIRTKEIQAKITKISKEINRNIKQEKKRRRQETFEKFISKTGALQKAYKELRDKSEWAAKLKNKRGRVLSKRPDIIKEATSFYKELYAANDEARQHDLDEPDVVNSTTELKSQSVLASEIEFAIKTQKNDKTPGNDNITNEVLKSLCASLQKPLQLLYDNILEKEKTPEQWSKSTITLIHKKGDRSDLGNYRPISLMTNMYKIFSKIILHRISIALDEHQPREQAGFRKKYSTMDHIQVITQIIEKANEYGNTFYLCFIDFKKAFDSLNHDAIWRALTHQQIGKKYAKVIQSIYSTCQSRVRLEREGIEFPVQRGVRQGDPLSPKIFSAVLESVFRELKWESKGIKVDGEVLSHLRFADDIVVFAQSASDLETMVNELERESRKVGLTLNSTKTKIITNGDREDISIEGEKIEYVKDYVYLGQLVSFENSTEKDIQRRIALAWKKYWGLKEIMKNKEINTNIKKKVFDIAILPCLTYGCQTWALRKEDEEKLAVCQRKMERSMLGIKISDQIRNKTIRKETKIVDIKKRIRQLKWKWAGHICRLENDRWTKRVTEWIPLEGKRKQGRPKMRWRDIFTQRCGPEWMRKARERDAWRDLGEAYAEEATIAQENNSLK